MATSSHQLRREPLGLFPNKSGHGPYYRIVELLRGRHYSGRPEEAYLHWIGRYIEFRGCRHPWQLAEGNVNRLLTHLAVKERVSASTQKQALCAILFLYEPVLEQPLDRIEVLVRASSSKRLPVVLTVGEVLRIMAYLSGDKWLIVMLLNGGRPRLLEALRLRVNDLDFERGEITVRSGKGGKDRVTTIAGAVIRPLQERVQRVRAIHQQELAYGYGRVDLPHALARKSPNANQKSCWPVCVYTRMALAKRQDRRAGASPDGRVSISAVGEGAVRAAGLSTRVTNHSFQHLFATRRLADGYDIRAIQELLGHKDVHKTIVCTHVFNRGSQGAKSPLDGSLRTLTTSSCAMSMSGIGCAAGLGKRIARSSCPIPGSGRSCRTSRP